MEQVEDVSAATSTPHWRHFAPLAPDRALSAATSEFAGRGYYATTFESMAALAGLSSQELCERYPSKHALLLATVSAPLDELRSRTAAALLEADGPLQSFTNVVECLTLFHAYRKDGSLLAQTEGRHLEDRAQAGIRAARVAEQRTVDATVRSGLTAGFFTTEQPREAARAVVSMCMGVSHWFNSGGPDTAEQVARHQVNFCLDVVGSTIR